MDVPHCGPVAGRVQTSNLESLTLPKETSNVATSGPVTHRSLPTIMHLLSPNAHINVTGNSSLTFVERNEQLCERAESASLSISGPITIEA